MERTQVKSLQHLKEICSYDMGEPFEFIIALNGSAYSRKVISYYPDRDYPFKDWYVFHFIDETEEDLDDDELMENTNIGTAIKAGAFYWEQL